MQSPESLLCTKQKCVENKKKAEEKNPKSNFLLKVAEVLQGGDKGCSDSFKKAQNRHLQAPCMSALENILSEKNNVFNVH
jgi:hypothetical protein